MRWSQATCTKTYYNSTSPLKNWSQAVVCVSTPKMNPQSRYFLVYSYNQTLFRNKNNFMVHFTFMIYFLSLDKKNLKNGNKIVLSFFFFHISFGTFFLMNDVPYNRSRDIDNKICQMCLCVFYVQNTTFLNLNECHSN